MPALRLTLLGTFNIEAGGQPSPLMRSPRGCALLASLVVARQGQSREALGDLLWESASTSRSLTRLRVLLSRLRDSLPPDVRVSRHSLLFRPQDTTFVDLYVLLDGLASPERQVLDAALQLYGGDLLDGFYLEDAPRFNEWLLLQRERLRQQVRDAYARLCGACAAEGAWAQGVAAAQRWLALDDLDEEAWRWSMRLMAGQGRLAAALEAYETLSRRLWQELAVEPEPSTVDLAHHLRATEADRDWDDLVVVQPWQPPPLPAPDSLSPPGMLPPNAYLPYLRNDDFHGRQDILKQLASALLPWSQAETELPHPVVVSGLGGMGKTQLAVEFAYRYGRFFAGGLFWINFSEAQNVASEVANLGGERVMRLFRAEEKLTLAERVARVQQAWQEHTPRLLIFDDCGDEDLLAQWLPVSGGCRVLITSRRGSWSRALRLTGISLPALGAPESVALLRRMVPDLGRDAAAEIAGEVGHLPLALHLAGGFLRRYPLVTPARYLAQLRHEGLLVHPSLRGRGSERSPTGHALDVARTFALSLERLDAGDAVDALALKLLAHAAAFAPGIPLSRDLLLGTVVAEDADLGRLLTAEEGLVRLLTLGLLTTVDRQRVVLHELLAAFSRERGGEDNAAQQAVERTVYERLHKQNQQRNSLFELPLAPAHLRFLVENALQRADIAAADLAFLYGVHLNLVADFAASQLTMQQGAAIYERQYGPDHPETARYLIGLGALYNRSGRYWKARAIYERVLTIRESSDGAGDGPTADALNNLGYQLILQGDVGAARPYLQRALAFELADPDHPRVASVWKNLGTVALACEDYAEAISCLQKSLDIRRRALGSRHPHTASTLEQMARLHLQRKAYDRAQDYFDRALAIFEETLGENHPHTARVLNGLGLLALARDDLHEAHAYLQRALDAQQAVFAGDHPELGITYRNLGDLALARGDELQAAVLFRRAVAILEKSVDHRHPDLRRAREQVQRLQPER